MEEAAPARSDVLLPPPLALSGCVMEGTVGCAVEVGRWAAVEAAREVAAAANEVAECGGEDGGGDVFLEEARVGGGVLGVLLLLLCGRGCCFFLRWSL